MILYDASNASLSWYGITFYLLAIWFLLLFFSTFYSGKHIFDIDEKIKTDIGTRILGAIMSLLMATTLLYFFCHKSLQSYKCSYAAKKKEFDHVGIVEDVKRTVRKPQTYRYEFSINGKSLIANVQGAECGFIENFVSFHAPKEGEKMRIKLYKSRIVYAESY